MVNSVNSCCAAIAFILSFGLLSCANGPADDSHYVSLGPRGYGADVLAFRFNHGGVLVALPAYIAQESANEFYTRRIGSLVRGQTTSGDVENLFGHGHSDSKRRDGFISYYVLPIYNAAEDSGGGRR